MYKCSRKWSQVPASFSIFFFFIDLVVILVFKKNVRGVMVESFQKLLEGIKNFFQRKIKKRSLIFM